MSSNLGLNYIMTLKNLFLENLTVIKIKGNSAHEGFLDTLFLISSRRLSMWSEEP